jgi:hypothetical protein
MGLHSQLALTTAMRASTRGFARCLLEECRERRLIAWGYLGADWALTPRFANVRFPPIPDINGVSAFDCKQTLRMCPTAQAVEGAMRMTCRIAPPLPR